jgi:hypothetical protein
MAFQSTINAQMCVAEFDLTTYFNNIVPVLSRGMYDSTVFGFTAPQFAPGLRMGTLHADGFYDSTVTIGSDPVLEAQLALTTPSAVSAAPVGFGIGNRVFHYYTFCKSYQIGIKVNSLLGNMADWEPTDGSDAGFSLHALAAEAVSTNSTSVDNAAASSNGGVGWFHCTAITGAPSVTVKVQHATDNATWVDLVTFSTVSASPSSQRVVIASGTTIRRYTRVISTFVGGTTPSLTYTAGFARR